MAARVRGSALLGVERTVVDENRRPRLIAIFSFVRLFLGSFVLFSSFFFSARKKEIEVREDKAGRECYCCGNQTASCRGVVKPRGGCLN